MPAASAAPGQPAAVRGRLAVAIVVVLTVESLPVEHDYEYEHGYEIRKETSPNS